MSSQKPERTSQDTCPGLLGQSLCLSCRGLPAVSSPQSLKKAREWLASVLHGSLGEMRRGQDLLVCFVLSHHNTPIGEHSAVSNWDYNPEQSIQGQQRAVCCVPCAAYTRA